MKFKDEKFKCGVNFRIKKMKKIEFIEVDIIDLYNGYGKLNDFKLLAQVFNELHEMGFKSDGLFREVGYYDSIDAIIINATKKLK